MTSFLVELRRRNVFRIAAAYLVAGWLLIQIAALLESSLGLPDWFDAVAIGFLALCFPVALLLAWAFEMTPEGMKPTEVSDDAAGFKALGPSDFVLIAAVAVVLGIAGVQFLSGPNAAPEETVAGAGLETPDIAPTGPAPVSDTSIAVLPFADLSPDGDQAYFGDGIAEEILNVLARIDGLQVTSRTSAFAFRSQSELGIRAIAAELRVRHILEGSVRKAGDTLRITAQLIDAETDAHLWSETFDRPSTAASVFEVQDEIASAIASELSARLGSDVRLEAASSLGDTDDMSAYDAYLAGHEYFIQRSYTNVPLAIARLEHAVELDPEFTRAWAELAVAYSVARGWAMNDRDYPVLAEAAARRALAMEPENAMALTALGSVVQQDDRYFDPDALLDYSRRAVTADPANATAHLFLGDALSAVGYFARAEEAYADCLEINPAYGQCLVRSAEAAFKLGDRELGNARLERLFERRIDDGYPGFNGALAANGDTLALTLVLSTMSRILPGDANWIVAPMRRTLSDEAYDRAEAWERFEARLIAQGFEADNDVYITTTFRLAFRTYDEIPTWRIQHWWWEPGYPGSLESAAARRRMIELGLPPFWREHGFPQICRPVGHDDFECSWAFMQ